MDVFHIVVFYITYLYAPTDPSPRCNARPWCWVHVPTHSYLSISPEASQPAVASNSRVPGPFHSSSDPTKSRLLVNQRVPNLLLPLLDDTKHAQQHQPIHGDKSKEGRKHYVQELVRKHTKRAYTASMPRHLSRVRTRPVLDEHVGIVVPTALELELQHALDERVLAVPHGLEVRACL